MKHHKALTVYCHYADIKSLKHFFRKRRYKAVVIAQEFVERGPYRETAPADEVTL